MPKTKIGKWAMWLMMVFVIMFAVSQVFYMLTISGIKMASAETIMAITVSIAGFASGIVAFILGLISIIMYKERSTIIYVVVVLGLFPLLFILGEFLFPH